MGFSDDFFSALEQGGVKIPLEQKEAIEKRFVTALTYQPQIGVFGKTGVGKSSLCNALFGQDICPISDVESCTRNPKEVILKIKGKGIKLLDVPGVGENSERDREYAGLYASLLPELDMVIWVLKADDRAFSSDEKFYKEIVRPHVIQGKPFYFVLNQVDKIEPFREWDIEGHKPGVTQFSNIDKKITAVSLAFECPKTQVAAVSANEKYNLVELMDTMIYALPNNKKVTMFSAVPENVRSDKSEENTRYATADEVEKIVKDITRNSDYAEKSRDVVRQKGFFGQIVDGVKAFFQGVGEIGYEAAKAFGRIITGYKDGRDEERKSGKAAKRGQDRGEKSGGNGCFITTAVCGSLNKGDDCAELAAFRDFRDNWLAVQSGGGELISEYYETAPKIVAAIDKTDNRDAVYRDIWNLYLADCLVLIRQGKMNECKIKYTGMVNDLKGKYQCG